MLGFLFVPALHPTYVHGVSCAKMVSEDLAITYYLSRFFYDKEDELSETVINDGHFF